MIRSILAIFGVLLLGCQADEETRCEELRTRIEQAARPEANPCHSHLDCLVAELIPGSYQALAVVPHDPAFTAILQSFDADCASPPARRRNLFESLCLEATCTLAYQGTAIDPLAVQGIIDQYCDCSTHEDCRGGKLCAGGCLCQSPCQAGCEFANTCADWIDFQLGSDIPSCVETCGENYANPQVSTMIHCLAEAVDCTTARACIP